MPRPDLARGEDGLDGVEPDDFLDFLPNAFRVRRGQVDLVDDRDDFVVVLDRLVDIGQGLRFDALGGVDDQERAFARGEDCARLRRRSRRGRACPSG